MSAQTLDRKPVAGKGTLKLLKIAYDAQRKPVETPVESWDLALDAEGQARQEIKAAAPGQYRIVRHGRRRPGPPRSRAATCSRSPGQGFDGASFRFNDLEIIPERKEYQPGETLRLLINTNQVNSTVLLFVRPSDGVYLPPKVIHAQGKSMIAEIGIVPRDMPNMFVEALTVADGKVHDEARDIAIPPESRIAQIADRALADDLQARPESQGQAQAHRARRETVPGFDGRRRLRQGRRVHLGGLERSRDQGVLLELEAAPPARRPNRASTDGFHNLTKQSEIAMHDLGAFGEMQVALRFHCVMARPELRRDRDAERQA